MITSPARNKWVTAMARYIVALVLLAIFAGPAFAQQKKEDTPMQADEKRKKAEAEKIDKQYDAIMRKNSDTSAAPVRSDPWQNMRGADDSKNKR
jgi:flagellar biosynthesis/type III secretory pathway M-ring protein FliF/YscJ